MAEWQKQTHSLSDRRYNEVAVRIRNITGSSTRIRRADTAVAATQGSVMPCKRNYILGTRAKPHTVSTLLYRDKTALMVEPRLRTPTRGWESHNFPGERRSPNNGEEGMLDVLRRFTGQWVAIRGNAVIASGDSPRSLITSVRGRGLRADSVFRVPSDARQDNLGES